MFHTNNSLIENISEEFNIKNEEANNIINSLFNKISNFILDGNKFYMNGIGTISIDNNGNILFSNNEYNNQYLESTNDNKIKVLFLEKPIYMSIFKNIRYISKNQKVYIEKFGSFYNFNIKFKADSYLKNIVLNKFNNNDVIEIIDENEKTHNKLNKFNIKEEDTLEEIIDNKDNNLEESNYIEMKEYTDEELLDINNITENINDTINIKKENKKSIKKLYLFLSIFIITLILYFISRENIAKINNNVENKKLYDIVNSYFNRIDSVELIYTTSKDMYYWDISKYLYGNATYWPLIYAYNNEKYSINNIIKKKSKIIYRNIPEFNNISDKNNFNNTLSKSFLCIYPILSNDNKFNHSLWALKLSAYYDINVFKNNSNIIPEKIYNYILDKDKSISSFIEN